MPIGWLTSLMRDDCRKDSKGQAGSPPHNHRSGPEDRASEPNIRIALPECAPTERGLGAWLIVQCERLPGTAPIAMPEPRER